MCKRARRALSVLSALTQIGLGATDRSNRSGICMPVHSYNRELGLNFKARATRTCAFPTSTQRWRPSTSATYGRAPTVAASGMEFGEGSQALVFSWPRYPRALESARARGVWGFQGRCEGRQGFSAPGDHEHVHDFLVKDVMLEVGV